MKHTGSDRRKNTRRLIPLAGKALLLGAACLALIPRAQANMAMDWNANLETAIKTTHMAPIPQIRAAAIVHTAIFDAVNGIERRYNPYFVTDPGPQGARTEAAAALAGYTTLLALFPDQKSALDAELAESLASIAGHEGRSQSILRGAAWGQAVANAILAWRALDGISATPAPYFGGTTPGLWRSIPNGTVAAVFPQFATMVPFAMTSHDQFRPGPPPALTSSEYAAAVNELKVLGRATGSIRTDEQTLIARFWNAVDMADERHAAGALLPEDADLADTARFFALLSIAGADALIAGMDSKYTYNLWRPYHAIRLADTDGNPDTTPDPDWTPLLTTPGHQEYISNHSVITGAFMRVLAALVGEENSIAISSPGLPGVVRTFARLHDSVEEVKVARIYAGFHYRFSVERGESVGSQIADYVLANFLQPLKEAGPEQE